MVFIWQRTLIISRLQYCESPRQFFFHAVTFTTSKNHYCFTVNTRYAINTYWHPDWNLRQPIRREKKKKNVVYIIDVVLQKHRIAFKQRTHSTSWSDPLTTFDQNFTRVTATWRTGLLNPLTHIAMDTFDEKNRHWDLRCLPHHNKFHKFLKYLFLIWFKIRHAKWHQP